MTRESILMPAIVLLWWTSTVLIVLAYRRWNPRINGGTTFDDYQWGESERVPAYVALPNQNYINLLELPVLFYVSCVFMYITESVSNWAVYLAWAYVLLRIIHSLIHITYNSVPQRFAAFLASNLVLSALMTLMTISIVTL